MTSEFKETRNLLGLSQVELSDVVGVSRSQVSQWETGKVSPSAAVWTLLDALLWLKEKDLLKTFIKELMDEPPEEATGS